MDNFASTMPLSCRKTQFIFMKSIYGNIYIYIYIDEKCERGTSTALYL